MGWAEELIEIIIKIPHICILFLKFPGAALENLIGIFIVAYLHFRGDK
jgi:hypothetical protein